MEDKTLELRRKVMHVIVGIIALILLIYKIINPLIIFIILIMGIIISLFSLKYNIPFIKTCLEIFERDQDKKRLPGRGVIFAIVGSLLVLKLFDENIAFASIIILIFADPISHLVGKYFGKTKSFIDKRKNIEGHIAGALIASIFAMFFVHPILAISGAITAMLFESLIIEIQRIELDDNLVIPLVAGTIMFIITEFILVY